MNPLDKDIILSLLKVDEKNIVSQSENEQLEFKKIFDRTNKAAKAKYSKELAAMHNSKGGYLVFGISDENELVGLTDFKMPDSAELVEDINEYFKPTFGFRQTVISINEKTLFILYVSAREDIPVVCIRSYPEIISEGTIYYKYSSQASPIHGEDLIYLMSSLKSQDTKKLANLEAKKTTIEFRPNIERGGSGLQNGAVEFKFTNKGKRFKIKALSTQNTDVIPYLYKTLPFFLESDIPLAVKVYSQDGVNILIKNYTIQFIVENELGEEYAIDIEGKGASIKFLEPTLI